MDFEVDGRWLKNNFMLFNKISSSKIGITRTVYTQTWLQAHKQIKRLMENAGLMVHVDGVGNIIGSWLPKEKIYGRIATGSHFDSVRTGGNYDGLLGVLSAIAAVKTLKKHKIPLNKQIDIIAFAGEEGERFKIGCLGSKAIAGLLDAKTIETIKDADGITLKEAILKCGFSADIHSCIIPPNYYDYFLELHIEQGPILENMGINIGIVTGIAAISRIKVTYIGEQGHAGTVPMNLRKDVTLALAETILKVREVVLATNANAVGTVGYIKIEPNVPNVIPGKVDFIIEIRSIHAKLKKELMDNILKQINNISKKYNVNSRVQIIIDEIPTLIDKQIVALIESSAKNLGYSTYRMISGAGHDASYMARITKIGMLFIPNRGGSHNPNEETDLEDIIRGTKTLTNILKTLSE